MCGWRWPTRARASIPKHAPRGPGEPGGWGLYLVSEIADDWGISPAEPGNCVWFELRFAA